MLQQIVSGTGYTPYYYVGNKSTYEMDFMVQKGKAIVSVEVKAEENLHAQSLKMYCRKYEPEYVVRISMSDYREQEWMTNLPLYAAENL